MSAELVALSVDDGTLPQPKDHIGPEEAAYLLERGSLVGQMLNLSGLLDGVIDAQRQYPDATVSPPASVLKFGLRELENKLEVLDEARAAARLITATVVGVNDQPATAPEEVRPPVLQVPSMDESPEAAPLANSIEQLMIVCEHYWTEEDVLSLIDIISNVTDSADIAARLHIRQLLMQYAPTPESAAIDALEWQLLNAISGYRLPQGEKMLRWNMPNGRLQAKLAAKNRSQTAVLASGLNKLLIAAQADYQAGWYPKFGGEPAVATLQPEVSEPLATAPEAEPSEREQLIAKLAKHHKFSDRQTALLEAHLFGGLEPDASIVEVGQTFFALRQSVEVATRKSRSTSNNSVKEADKLEPREIQILDMLAGDRAISFSPKSYREIMTSNELQLHKIDPKTFREIVLKALRKLVKLAV